MLRSTTLLLAVPLSSAASYTQCFTDGGNGVDITTDNAAVTLTDDDCS